MDAAKTATVLIAEPGDDARRNEECRKAVNDIVVGTADSTGGLLVSNRGGKLILRFATPDAAASAASKIHAAVDELPEVGGAKPGVQISFHTGPVAQAGLRPADETVSLALKLVEKAQGGQTVASQETVDRLNPAFREFSRSMLSLQNEASMCEVVSWHQRRVRPKGWSEMTLLRLSWRDQLAVCSREKETVVIGREDDCDFVIVNHVTSRRHCTLRFRDGQFALIDHSRNGTYLYADGKGEVQLKKSGALLAGHGTFAIGQPQSRGGEVIEFCSAVVT